MSEMAVGQSGPASVNIIERLSQKLDHALEALAAAKDFAKSPYQTQVFQLAETMMSSDEGMVALFERAPRFDGVGVFVGGPWADVDKLQAPLVAGSLRGGGVYPIVEALSELRLLAIATGRTGADEATRQSAVEFLDDVMALNLEYIFPGGTEEERITGGPHRDLAIRLFALLADTLELRSLRGNVLAEIEQITAQRPVMTSRVRSMIEMAARIPADESDSDEATRLQRFRHAVGTPSALSQAHPDVASYRRRLTDCDEAALASEARAFASSMRSTGLTCPFHAVLLRHLRSRAPSVLPEALALNDVGEAELAQNQELVHQLIKVSLLPTTSQSIYGFARVLENGLLSRQEVAVGIRRLIDLDLQSDVRRHLLARRTTRDGVTANALLVAGVLAVLGQPLGVGQGRNPTCQAARAISLWAQHAPGYLLELLVSAARDGFVEMSFESETLRSDQLIKGLAVNLHHDLDPVSLVLTTHLDRLYASMMERTTLRDEDGHKWVNPALYGRWVPKGFCSVFADRAQTQVADYDEFLRRFYATHHPAYNDDHVLMYPNPVGLLITNGHGAYLGPHAVSLQRIAEDGKGVLRAFFFNPNNEGRQDWGQGIKPAIRGHGEVEGESSLPFHEFAGRLYAFHFNPYEEGDAYAVPLKEIEEIETVARASWGRAFRWV